MRGVIVDQRISAACERKLTLLGFHVIKLPPFSGLPEAISSHPDSLIFRLGDELLSFCDYCDTAPYIFTELRELFPTIKISFADDTPKGSYPGDCKYNALPLSGRLYGRQDSLSKALKALADRYGLVRINTKQGYPACTTLALTDGEGKAHALTSDAGMARILRAEGVTVTEIVTGGISLEPYEYGFIGGCAGVHDGKVYFLGDIKRHPDCGKILAALKLAGHEAVSLSDEELCDAGGMIFIE